MVKLRSVNAFFNQMKEIHYCDLSFDELWALSRNDLKARNEILARQQAHWDEKAKIIMEGNGRLLEGLEAFSVFLDDMLAAMKKLRPVLDRLAKESQPKDEDLSPA